MSKLSVVLVNYRGWRDTIECVESLRRLDYSPLEIIVVENGSPDESRERLEGLGDVRLLRLDRNLGFAGGCNVGMRAARETGAEFVWLLNNDTIVESHAASALVDLARRRPEAHFFGSLICLAADPLKLWFAGGTFDWRTGTAGHLGFMKPVAAFSSPQPVPTSWISACSLLIRASSLETVGYMDEDLFLYAEDLEWQLRSSRVRQVSWIVRECLVHHKVGRSTGSTDAVMGRLFMSRNFLKLAWRYAGPWLPLWLGRWAMDFLVKPVLKGKIALARAGLAGLLSQYTAGADIVARFRGRAGV
jgi:GT2 family glycosyltransferase